MGFNQICTLVSSSFLSIVAILSANPSAANIWKASEIHHFYTQSIE